MREISSKLYELFPEVYRTMDEKQSPSLPLQRFMQILSEGMGDLEDSIVESRNMLDVESCNAEFLDDLAKSYNFRFHHSFTEEQKRRFLKVLPALYEVKGNNKAFEYISRAIFGKLTNVTVTKHTYVNGETPEQYRRLDVLAEVDGDFSDTDTGTLDDQFIYTAEQFRPVNYKLFLLLVTIYFEYRALSTTTATNEFFFELFESYDNILKINGVDVMMDGVENLWFLVAMENKGVKTNAMKTYGNQTVIMSTTKSIEYLDIL